jgi:polyhydroxyalkanoate synthesis repressor PhaR
MSEKQPVTIKKYANRRLYDTGTSAYVTLEDLGQMVKSGQDFQVFDAKTGEEITRSVLAQIIFEQEGKDGQAMLPVTFLRQLIRFYGDSIQALVPSYLEFTLDRFSREQAKFRQQWTDALGDGPLAGQTRHMLENLEDQTRKNMALFRQALEIFSPFGTMGVVPEKPRLEPAADDARADLDDLKRQVADLQKRIETIAAKP